MAMAIAITRMMATMTRMRVTIRMNNEVTTIIKVKYLVEPVCLAFLFLVFPGIGGCIYRRGIPSTSSASNPPRVDPHVDML